MSLYNKIIDLQKLNMAWEKVLKNKPACGVDNVTCEQFDENKAQELKQLNMELREHTYQPLPVKRITIYKGDKAREIALYSMRDKVVQQSLASELNKIYDIQFSGQTYAYRSNKSALNAVNELDMQIQKKQFRYILKLDIVHFFDTIQWSTLKTILKRNIREEDVMELIEVNAKTRILEESGEIIEKRCGIHQGSGIAPVLSNIYLMEFDHAMAGRADFFIRYSDDMVVLGSDEQKLLELWKYADIRLQTLGLQLHKEKSMCVSLDVGVEFLGYKLSADGKTIPQKAEQSLQERLENMWLTSARKSIKEKLKKALEIVGGWEQYFREKRKAGSILEYAALMYASEKNSHYFDELKNERASLINIYKDIMLYLSEIWREKNEVYLELLEYEQYYQIWNEKDNIWKQLVFDKAGKQDSEPVQKRQEVTAEESMYVQEKQIQLLLEYYRKVIIFEEEDVVAELMQLYTDLGEYEKAAFWMKKKDGMTRAQMSVEVIKHNDEGYRQEIIYDPATVRQMMKIFVGREDIYGLETLGYGAKRQVELQENPLTEQIMSEHLAGQSTLATYIQRSNSTVKYFVVDIDVSKKIILQYDSTSDEYCSYLKKAYQKARELVKMYHTFGMEGYIEYSGYRGYHVWTFFTEWIPVRYVNMLSDLLEARNNWKDEDGITVEFFPNKTRIRAGKFGQTIKLPFGIHVKTGQSSYFLNEDGEKIVELNMFFDSISKSSVSTIKKILAANVNMQENIEEKTVDVNLEAFQEASENVKEILKNCNLMRYLCQKACKTGYLTHFERMSVLYVFGHLGEEGRQFVHLIMSFTLNYQYNTTEKFIRKIPEKPISCVKLREQYKKITAEFGCNCSFKRSKNCYPSPVMHAITHSNDLQDDITLPTVRTIPKDKEKQVVDEINIHKKVQELAKKILEMKKQKRSLDAAIRKTEKEMENIFDNAGVDCLEIEMGMLVRRKKDDAYEWLIEI